MFYLLEIIIKRTLKAERKKSYLENEMNHDNLNVFFSSRKVYCYYRYLIPMKIIILGIPHNNGEIKLCFDYCAALKIRGNI